MCSAHTHTLLLLISLNTMFFSSFVLSLSHLHASNLVSRLTKYLLLIAIIFDVWSHRLSLHFLVRLGLSAMFELQ